MRPIDLREGAYAVRLATTEDEVRAAQRLRFEVFHLELGEGLAGAAALGRDEDPFDPHCDHLILTERKGGAVVGTYRMQTAERAERGAGLYCAQEFDLDALPAAVLAESVELGRACIARGHRQGNALRGLWRGIAAYLTRHDKRYLFGCSSLTGTDERVARVAARWIETHGQTHAALRVPVRTECAVAPADVRDEDLAAFRLPSLFGTYLRYGARVCSPPAIDREFGTTDFLIILDSARLPPRVRSLFF